jgi:hypothetical protein
MWEQKSITKWEHSSLRDPLDEQEGITGCLKNLIPSQGETTYGSRNMLHLRTYYVSFMYELTERTRAAFNRVCKNSVTPRNSFFLKRDATTP